MASIVNKIKEAVHSDKSHEKPEGTHGPHSSRVANAADPRIDSDRDHRANPASTVGGTGHGTTGTHGVSDGYTSSSHYTTSGGPASHTAGPHQSDLANRADPRIDSDRDGRFAGNTAGAHGSGTAEGVHGPHSSRVANALDPRVDSDRDGSRTAGNTYGSSGTAGTTGAHTTTGTHGLTGAHGTTGSHGLTGSHATTGTTGSHGLTGSHATAGTTGTAEGVHGPHGSRMANAADPRVDSDRDGSRTVGGNQYGTTGATGSHGLTGTHGTTGTHGVAGTHGTTGTHGVSGTHGTHGTSHGVGSGVTSGPGPAPHTAGPHKSDMANKLDPRVDSNLDGSKTVGGNKTYGA